MDYLYHSDGEGAHHEPDEVLRRIAPAFRYVVIDKARGDRLIQEKYTELLDMRAPEVILRSHRSLFGRTVFVTLADDDAGALQIRFLLQPCCEIRVKYDAEWRRDEYRPMLEKLAGLLGYEIRFQEFDAARGGPGG